MAHTRIFIAHQTRSLKTERLFFTQLKDSGFEWIEIQDSELDPSFKNGIIRIFEIKMTTRLA